MILEEDVTAFWLFNIDSTTGKVLMSKWNAPVWLERAFSNQPGMNWRAH